MRAFSAEVKEREKDKNEVHNRLKDTHAAFAREASRAASLPSHARETRGKLEENGQGPNARALPRRLTPCMRV